MSNQAKAAKSEFSVKIGVWGCVIKATSREEAQAKGEKEARKLMRSMKASGPTPQVVVL